ncbi:heme-dependent oxidative N-demethylase family protein [Mesobacterium pallidum]|uniref:heme-dependent oxidative N-demethylase family protein n=1 Tax=Mesobacterium pallidum TaxID=2872037 RepID=UPI001EE24A12|nr:DUF3445 domain-containing protein [Mesobacterium pallidum]
MTTPPPLQSAIPYPLAPRALPGIQPLDPADWLLVDDAYAGQLAERRLLLRARRADVLQVLPGAEPAAEELRTVVLEHLRARADFDIDAGSVRCPDGHVVPLTDDPLGDLGAMVQEDFCLMEKPEGAGEHVLTAAVLCFPSRWTLAQKIGRPLMRIHAPVAPYDDDIGKRVQRLFDGVRAGRPLWRSNLIRNAGTALFNPAPEFHGQPTIPSPYLRSERQCILRLPATGAVVFSIHTFLVRAGSEIVGR